VKTATLKINCHAVKLQLAMNHHPFVQTFILVKKQTTENSPLKIKFPFRALQTFCFTQG